MLKSHTDMSVHQFFGLSYSSYLVLPRLALQHMPEDWQEKFVSMLEEVRETFDTDYWPGRYSVNVRDKNGRFVKDSMRDYRRGSDLLKFRGNNDT